jgi:uncharacterized membrane protein YoaK (UPF0700 family)
MGSRAVVDIVVFVVGAACAVEVGAEVGAVVVACVAVVVVVLVVFVARSTSSAAGCSFEPYIASSFRCRRLN